MSHINEFSVIDLFCGVGALSYGFKKEGFNIAAGFDIDKSCEFAFTKNTGANFIEKDISLLSYSDLADNYKQSKYRILVGCAPCQPFSIYNHKTNNNAEKQSSDLRWRLLYSFSNLINEVEPDIISMENVPQLLKFNDGKVFSDFINTLLSKKYHVSYGVFNAQDYGVPQRRRRLILLASKYSEIKMIAPTHSKQSYITVRDTIEGLPEIEDGQSHPLDPLHYSRKLSSLNKRRIMATKEGGSWKDWDKSLQLKCHKKKSGRVFRSVYGRMKWDDVAPTITTYCLGISNGRFGHPEQNRAISLKEAALFQSFPQDYIFIDPAVPFSPRTIARHIGNAVPVKLSQAIAQSIKNHIASIDG